MSGPIILGTNSIKDTGYNVDNSARFNDASDNYLNKTFGSSGNRKTFTISFWIKKCVSKDHGQSDGLMILGGQQNSYPGFLLIYNRTTDTLVFRDAQASNNIKFDVRTDAKFRDLSAWHHIVIAMDTTQGTASNRIKVYINGTQTTDLNGNAASGGATEDPLYPDQNFDSQFNGNEAHYIGQYATNYEDFYLCEYCFIDGQQLAADQFGEFDSDSPTIWKPKDVSGLTFGTNGFYLDFKDSSDFGNDANGSNNWTANNFTAEDQSTDTCTNNFATLNPIQAALSSATFSENNLKSVTAGTSGENFGGGSSIGVASGKWYFEAKATVGSGSADRNVIGVTGELSNIAYNKSYTGTSSTAQYQSYNGQVISNNTTTEYTASLYATGDIIQIALDIDNLHVYFGKNGTWQNSGDPTSGATGTGAVDLVAISSTTDGFYFVYHGDNSGVSGPVSTFEFNFGSPSFTISSGNADGNGYGNFEYAVPSGYFSLCTKNLAEYG